MAVLKKRIISRTSLAKAEARDSQYEELLQLIGSAAPLLAKTMTRQERSLCAKIGRELRDANPYRDGCVQWRAITLATLRRALLNLRWDQQCFHAEVRSHIESHRST
jgi:hypothetical protein